MKTFLGVGVGPIQTGIFVAGAAKGGYERIVLADVNIDVVRSVRIDGMVTVNTACNDFVRADAYGPVEILNPDDTSDCRRLTDVVAEADVITTALPSTLFYRNVAPWLSAGFQRRPRQRRFVYTAENSTAAARELESIVGSYPGTAYLDTVIGKMSKVFTAAETSLAPLAVGCNVGHLVEEYNDIFTTSAPGQEEVSIVGLYPKVDLKPFEEAKLFGHNTAHFLLGRFARRHGCSHLDEVTRHPEAVTRTVDVLLNECGVALARRHQENEPSLSPACFTPFALRLVERMIHPVLHDSVDRILRDPLRKLGWNDRLVGAVRLCMSQGVVPTTILRETALLCTEVFGHDRDRVRQELVRAWQDADHDDGSSMASVICDAM